MHTLDSIIQISVYLAAMSIIAFGILSKVKVSSVKFMLLGVALIAFSNSVLKEMIRYGIDDVISIIGLSFCVVGFFKSDK
jgi:hypothetical protein